MGPQRPLQNKRTLTLDSSESTPMSGLEMRAAVQASRIAHSAGQLSCFHFISGGELASKKSQV